MVPAGSLVVDTSTPLVVVEPLYQVPVVARIGEVHF
jgi:hypothetical protein